MPAWSFPFLAGGLSGAAAAFVGQPFDTLKVRMQTGWTVKGASPTTAVDYLKLTVRALTENKNI